MKTESVPKPMKAIELLMNEARKETFVNPENPAQATEELTLCKHLRSPLNFEGSLRGYSVKVVTPVTVGGHGATTLHAWKWAH